MFALLGDAVLTLLALACIAFGGFLAITGLKGGLKTIALLPAGIVVIAIGFWFLPTEDDVELTVPSQYYRK